MLRNTPIADVRSRDLLLVTGVSALILQTVIVTYNTITGYIRVETYAEYLLRVLYAALISAFLGLLILWPDLAAIRWLNRRFPWGKATATRMLIQLGTATVIAVTISTGGTLLVNAIHAYTNDLPGVLVTNALITIVINLLLMTVLEAWLFFREGKIARLKAEMLRTELTATRFEVLKSQINPHFMFNSLNVLSGLIRQDAARAQEFVDEFAHIYHYVLESIEKPVVTLGEELRFARSYMYLQQIRHGDHISMHVDLPADSLELVLPPLSLQVVLENALKHNHTGAAHPLAIRLTANQSWLEVRNTLRPRQSTVVSTGIGQNNLVRRYALIGNLKPGFRIENNEYIARLPLLPCEN